MLAFAAWFPQFPRAVVLGANYASENEESRIGATRTGKS